MYKYSKYNDDKCFMYAVQCGVYEIYNKPHPERHGYYNNDKFKKEIPASKYVNFDNCNFPMEIDDDVNNSIEEFEKDNGNRISINVYGIHKDIKKHGDDSLIGDYVNNIDESRQSNNINKDDRLLITEDDYDKYIFPMYITKNTKPKAIHIDLLHIVDEDNNGHFVYIKDFEKLMGSSGKHKGYYCKHCLSKFTSHERLCSHYKMGCYDVVGTLKLMPKEDQNIIGYQSKGYEELAPFVIESDFECFNIKHNTTTRNNQKSYTDIISTHEPNSYAIHISISNQFENKIDEVDLESFYLYRGDNTIENFIVSLIDIQEKS